MKRFLRAASMLVALAIHGSPMATVPCLLRCSRRCGPSFAISVDAHWPVMPMVTTPRRTP